MKILVAIDIESKEVSLYQSVKSFLDECVGFVMIDDLFTESTQLATEEQIQNEIGTNGSCVCIVTHESYDSSFKLSYETIRE